MIRRPPRSTLDRSSAASDVYKRQGYNSRIVAGAWVGAEDPAIRWRSTALGQGAATALPIFGKFMNKSNKDPKTRKFVTGGFTAPPDSLMMQLDCALWVPDSLNTCLLYTSDAADERSSVDLGGRRIIKKKKLN